MVAKQFLAGKDREHFIAMHIDSRNRVVSIETVSIGTLDFVSVHPREVFKAAILANARAIICAHNHPSGGLQPSDADRKAYDTLKASGELLGIPLLDFLIVSDEGTWASSESW